jgi:hypothetical protein
MSSNPTTAKKKKKKEEEEEDSLTTCGWVCFVMVVKELKTGSQRNIYLFIAGTLLLEPHFQFILLW